VGVAGELYLGGAGLAHGYWKLPELTAEHFIFDVQGCTSVAEDRSPRATDVQGRATAKGTTSVAEDRSPRAIHPFDPADGARLYRTGDQVRYRSDGTIEFLGRCDQQVKVRGFRIELGEIEVLLSAHPAVQECLALVRQDRPGEKQLVAYWTPRPGKKPGNAPSSAELRAYLANKLPDYMVPAAFVPLERLPLTPNGKPDRAALPAPFQDTASRVPVAAPHGPLEQVIAGLYAQVLGHEQIDREESFFALGGHSLLAMQVLARLREALGVSVPVRTLFEAPTVSALSAWLTATAPDPARLAARARLYNDVAQLSPEAVQVQLAQRRVGRGARGDSKLG
jgi:aryl carrier-like protein